MISSKQVEEGNTLLHEAAKIGNNEVVVLLLENGADVNATDQEGNTPLHEAAKIGNNEVANLLLSYGANFNADDNELKKPLDLATSDSLKAILMNTNLLFDSIINRDEEEAKKAIKGKAAVNAKDEYGFTPLILTAYYGQYKLVDLLLENGADVNATDQNGNTPLYWLYYSTSSSEVPKCHYYFIANLLLKSGANVDTKINGETLLSLAAFNGDTKLARLLL